MPEIVMPDSYASDRFVMYAWHICMHDTVMPVIPEEVITVMPVTVIPVTVMLETVMPVMSNRYV